MTYEQNSIPTEKAQAVVRLLDAKIIPWRYTDHEWNGEGVEYREGEAVQTKAVGHFIFENELFPISIHMTVPPGVFLPHLGDDFEVIVRRLELREPE